MTGGSESEGFEPETGSTPGGVTHYRKKPIALEARQVCSPLGHETAAWCGSRYDDVLHHIIVHTLEGPLAAHSGDWIIKGTRGEFWPVRADIFAETYEPASSPGPAGDQVSVGLEDLRWAMGLKTLTAATADRMRAAQARIMAAAGDPR